MNIAEDIGTVVTLMQDGSEIPYYLYGHRLEISNRLSKKELSKVEKYKKYPLIALNEMHNPLPKRRGNVYDWRLNIAILAPTKVEYYSQDREEKVFQPTLDPLYESFITQIRNSGLFFWSGLQDAPPHEVVRRKFFGIPDKEGNIKFIFPDFLDAIEILNLELSQEIC